MNRLAGIGKLTRERLALVSKASGSTVVAEDVERALGFDRASADKLLAKWAKSGWMARVKQGVYIKVPLEASTPEGLIEDAWLVAKGIYQPCYIGGWSAAEYWDLTEQIFRTVVVFTSKQVRNRTPEMQGIPLLIKTMSKPDFVGTKLVWRGAEQILVSDPSRTIVDILVEPRMGGGIRTVKDVLGNYIKSDKKDFSKIIEYAESLDNSAVFKRLGFLLEKDFPDEVDAIKQCSEKLRTGNVKLDQSLECNKLVTRWKLWVPENWVDKK